VKWDSPFVLTLAGTIAIHTILLVGADAVMVVTPDDEPEVPPRLELIEIKVEKPKAKEKEKPKPPPPQLKLDIPEVKPEPVKTPVKTVRQPVPQVRTAPPPPTDTPPPQNTSPDSGGSTAPTLSNYQLTTDNGQADAIIHKKAKPGRGQGGIGTGTGSGSGAGSASAPPAPVSVATIKKRAMPKGDYGYIDASRDYPAEARQRSIEGPIRVKLIVGDDGVVRDATLLNRLGYGLDELALERAKKIQFDPARDTDDKAVSSIVIWTFNMTLPK
jgi:periplasmic protein TonB